MRLPVSIETPIGTQSVDEPRWSVANEWPRLDLIAGLVMQTGTGVVVAALTFASNIQRSPTHAFLLVTAVLAFASVLAAILAIGVTLLDLFGLAEQPRRYKYKRRLTTASLAFLLVAVEGGGSFTAISFF